MITQMRHISISGHTTNLEHAVKQYLCKYDIQLINQQGAQLSTTNPYASTFHKATTLAKLACAPPVIALPTTDSAATNLVEEYFAKHEQTQHQHASLVRALETANSQLLQLSPFLSLDISNMFACKFIHHRFGKLTKAAFLQWQKFAASKESIVFVPSKKDEHHVWGVYFTPKQDADSAHALFASLYFESFEFVQPFDDGRAVSPRQLAQYWQNECENLTAQLNDATNFAACPQLAIACQHVTRLYKHYDIHKYATISPRGQIFTFSGWVTSKTAQTIEAKVATDSLILLTVSQHHPSPPPTVIHNPPVVRSFEFFTKLYGLPAHNEIDPTPFVAITYTGLFGLMFGDVGHGLVFVFLGWLLQRRFTSPLGSIISIAGLSATIFGLLYGSIFGFEDILPAIWRRPAQDITATLIFAVVLGVALVAVSILLNMYNSLRQHNIIAFLFGPNGASGLIFYGSVIFIAVRFIMYGLPFSASVAFFLALPLCLTALKHPLERYFAGQRIIPPGGVPQFVFNTFVELFETLLTYATNTISFVRVGAFAVSHAGMMHVVLQLSQGAAGTRNWLIVIAGNIIVMGIEGLLVGIQVLRLDFYEMFSRFYTGSGKVFTSHKLKEW